MHLCVCVGLGVLIGFIIESDRTASVVENYKNNEISALDLRLQNYYYQTMDRGTCDLAIQQNFIFADKLYNEGLKLEKYEEANQITEDLLLEKKRYVLLKTELWLNTILLNDKCNDSFNTIVYIYSTNQHSSIVSTEQNIISNVLKEVKDDKGNSVVLIPIAGDLDLQIVDLQLRTYNISDFPAVLINEETILYGYHSKEEIESYLVK
jgi:phosphomevalonate kinase